MEYELTDTHCHILPGLDDGSLNMEETLQVLREAERQNVGRMIVTPHFYPGKYVAVNAGGSTNADIKQENYVGRVPARERTSEFATHRNFPIPKFVKRLSDCLIS